MKKGRYNTMNENNENMKAKISAWWEKNGSKIKIAVGVGFACFTVGFIKGMMTESKYNADAMNKMMDKIPYDPQNPTILDYISEHVEELKPVFEAEKQAYEDFLN